MSNAKRTRSITNHRPPKDASLRDQVHYRMVEEIDRLLARLEISNYELADIWGVSIYTFNKWMYSFKKADKPLPALMKWWEISLIKYPPHLEEKLNGEPALDEHYIKTGTRTKKPRRK